MLRSLRTRLLVVVVAVGIASIGATAIIAQQVATNDMRQTLDRRVETRRQVLDALQAFSAHTGSWRGADEEVERLANIYGERVGVYTVGGEVIVDSDPGASLPSQPVGFVDLPPDVEDLQSQLSVCGLGAWADEIDNEIVIYAGGASDTCIQDVLNAVEFPTSGLVYIGTAEGDPASVLGPGGPNRRLVVVAALVLLGAIVVMALALEPVLAPISVLRAGARRLEEGHLNTRVSETGARELAGLARSFNTMAAALQADRERQQRWTSDTAHELRNPVQNLQGHLEAAKDGLMQPNDEWLDSMLDEVGQLGHLVADLGTLTLSDAGRVELVVEPVELRDVVDDVVASHGPRAAQNNVALTATGSARIEGDERRLRQAISNLVDNALRHTPAGGSVTVAVLDAKDGAEVRVTDTGDGIPAEAQERIFDRFARVDSHRARHAGGTGLGLSIVSALVDAHGGQVAVESVEGAGSTFVLTLPRSAETKGPDKQIATSPRR